MKFKYDILTETPMHIGDNPEEWGNVPFIGKEWISTFDLPNLVKGPQNIMLAHRSIDGDQNEIVVNGQTIKLGRSDTSTDGSEELFEFFPLPGGTLRRFVNTVTIRSLNASGTDTGQLDDFILLGVGIFYPIWTIVDVALAERDKVVTKLAKTGT